MKSQLEGAGVQGGAALDKLRASLERLNAQDTNSLVQSLARVKQAAADAQSAASQAQANAFAGVKDATDYKSRAADVAAYGAQLDALRAKFVPLFATSKEYEGQLDEIAAAERLGAISANEAAAARARVTDAFAKANAPIIASTSALKAHTEQSGAASVAARNLGIQFTQAISGLATGQPVLTTLIQQGHQVVDSSLAMGTGFSGLGTAAKAAFSAVGGFPTLTVVAGTAAVAALAAEGNAYLGTLNSTQQALRGTQDNYTALGQTVVDVSRKVSASSGLGFDEALSAAKAIASNRYFSGTAGDLERLTRDAENLGAVMGGGAAAGARALASGLSDPSKAAADLSTQFSATLTPELLRQIDLAEKAGDRAGAYKLLLGGLEAASKDAAAQGLGPLSKAWQDLGNSFTNATSAWTPVLEAVTNRVARMIDVITALTRAATEAGNAVAHIPSTVNRLAANGGVDNDGMPIGSATGDAAISVSGTPRGVTEAVLTATPTKDAFVTQWLEAAKLAGSQLGVSPQTILAQFGLETGFGKSTYNYNLGNIKPGDGYTGSTFVNPGDQQSYRSYASAADFAADFVAVIKQKSPDVQNTGSDVAAYARGLHPGQQGGYAEDPNYGTKLASVAASFSLPPDMVNNAKAASDATAELVKNARDYKNQQIDAQLQDDSYKMVVLSATTGTQTEEYKALQQEVERLTAARYANVDAITAAQRASDSALRASQGYEEGERGLSAAIEARRQVALSAGLPFGDQEQQQATLEYLARQSQAAGQLAYTLQKTVSQNSALAASYDQGSQSVIEATAHQQALNEAMRLFPNSAAQQQQVLPTLEAAYQGVARSAADLAAAQKNAAANDNLDYLRAEISTLGEDEAARTRNLAVFKATQEAHRVYGDNLTDQAKRSIELAGTTADLTSPYQHQQQVLSDVTGAFSSMADTIANDLTQAFVQGSGASVNFKTILQGVETQVLSLVAKLALVNPVLNAIDGKERTTFSDVGGLLGKLVGSSSSGSANDNTAFDAAGALVGGTGAGSGFDTDIGSVATSAKSSGLGLTDSLGTVGAIVKVGDYLTGGHLISDLSSGIKDAASSIGSTSLYSSAPTAGGLTVPAGAADDVATATGSVANPSGALSGVNVSVGSAIGVVGGLYGAYSGFERGGLGGTIQGVGGVAAAGLAAAGTGLLGAGAAGLAAAAGPYAPIALAAIAIIGALLPGAHPKNPYQDTEVDVQGGHLVAGK